MSIFKASLETYTDGKIRVLQKLRENFRKQERGKEKWDSLFLAKNLHKELNCVHNKKTLYNFVVEDWSADWKNFS